MDGLLGASGATVLRNAVEESNGVQENA